MYKKCVDFKREVNCINYLIVCLFYLLNNLLYIIKLLSISFYC